MTILYTFQLCTLRLFLQRLGLNRILRTNNYNIRARRTYRLNLQSVATGTPIQRRGTHRQMTTNSKETSVFMRLPSVMWNLTITSVRPNRQTYQSGNVQNQSTRLRYIQHVRTTSNTLNKTYLLRSNMGNEKVNYKYSLVVGNGNHTYLRHFRPTNCRAMPNCDNRSYGRCGSRRYSRSRVTHTILFSFKEYRGGSSLEYFVRRDKATSGDRNEARGH